MSELYRVVYTSRNLLEGSDAARAAAIADILATSQRNNGRVGVSGALLFNDGAFAQVLEGPRPVVESTFERIQRDIRHSDVNVLQCEAVSKRGFPAWSMAFAGQSARGRAMWNDLASRTGFDLSKIEGEDLFSTLHNIVLAEEAEVPAPVADGQTDGRGRDFDRLRAELHEAMPAERHPAMTEPLPSPAGTAAGSAISGPAQPTTEAAVLRAALAAERERTTALRRELDEAHVALAVAAQDKDRLRQQRDLWAARIRAVATALTADVEAHKPEQPPALRTVA